MVMMRVAPLRPGTAEVSAAVPAEDCTATVTV